MSTTVTLSIAMALITAVLISSISGPAFAAKNRGYSNGLASIVKVHDNLCSDIHDRLVAAEVGAEADAHTPAGDRAQKEADDTWQEGVNAGCGWAA
jgi:hypothetical protein